MMTAGSKHNFNDESDIYEHLLVPAYTHFSPEQ